MNGRPSYRIAGRSDAPVVVGLLEELVDELGPPEMAARVKPLLPADIERALASDGVRIFLVEVGDEVAGLGRADVLTTDPIFRLRLDHRCGYVDQMFVRPRYRNRGIGEHLLGLCERWFRDQGIAHSLLHAAPKAVSFYSRHGYQPNREMFKRL